MRTGSSGNKAHENPASLIFRRSKSMSPDPFEFFMTPLISSFPSNSSGVQMTGIGTPESVKT